MSKKIPPLPKDRADARFEQRVSALQSRVAAQSSQRPPKALDDALRTILKAPPPKKDKPK